MSKPSPGFWPLVAMAFLLVTVKPFTFAAIALAEGKGFVAALFALIGTVATALFFAIVIPWYRLRKT